MIIAGSFSLSSTIAERKAEEAANCQSLRGRELVSESCRERYRMILWVNKRAEWSVSSGPRGVSCAIEIALLAGVYSFTSERSMSRQLTAKV
jgi:hypothetical protein